MTDSPNSTIPLLTRRSLLHAGLLFGAGGLVGAVAAGPIRGRGGLVVAASPVADATATRAAELEELHALQTQVARPPVCTPAPTETPIPPTPTATTVPAVASGQPLPHGAEWMVTVVGIQQVPATGDLSPQGQLIRLDVTVQNLTNGAASPPFTDWVLVASTGDAYGVDLQASAAIGGAGWALKVPAQTSESRAMAFDVPTDAGTSFVLESRRDPSFRVDVALQSFG